MALSAGPLPTLYEYYTGNGIAAGLSDKQPYFTLNDKNITIYSGAFHYFRVPRAYWRDRLKKMRAAGLNTVETYVPWNLHEPHSGVYDFGNGGSDMEDFLHVEEFLKTAQEEDLFALVRSGPYINSEWEFGGMPSWIMRTVRTIRNSNDEYFLTYVRRFFNVLLPILAALTFQNGGPIIGIQIENEYGSTNRNDVVYLQAIQQLILDHGIKELLYTSDPPRNEKKGAIPGVLQTANFAGDPKTMLDWLNTLQSNKPTMAMESYTGWFDRWLETHHHRAPSAYKTQLEQILDYPSSVNMYMFIGSTNFGFLNGAALSPHFNNSGLQPETTSYDYDSPITEYGGYTAKYNVIKEVIAARNEVKTKIPIAPEETPLVAYSDIEPDGQLLIAELMDSFEGKIESTDVIPMEKLNINHDSGQSFGYIIYRKTGLSLEPNSILKIPGYIGDTVLVLVNGKLVSPPPKNADDINGFGFWRLQDSSLILTDQNLEGATLDLVLENFGRNTLGGLFFKGLTDDVYINNLKITNWQIAPFEFKKSWNNNLKGWHNIGSKASTPALYKFTLNLTSQPQDTYLDMREWNKGITIVNGFVLGRHFFVGPQQSLYLPAPFLKNGNNSIIVFEHYNAPNSLKFSSQPIFGAATHE